MKITSLTPQNAVNWKSEAIRRIQKIIRNTVHSSLKMDLKSSKSSSIQYREIL